MIVQSVPKLIDGALTGTTSTVQNNRDWHWSRYSCGYFDGYRICISIGLSIRSLGDLDNRGIGQGWNDRGGNFKVIDSQLGIFCSGFKIG